MPVDKRKIEKIKELARLYGVTRLILFGSAVDTPNEAKDMDLACDGLSGWKLYELAARIEEEILMPVDLVPLNPPSHFISYILKKGRVLL